MLDFVRPRGPVCAGPYLTCSGRQFPAMNPAMTPPDDPNEAYDLKPVPAEQRGPPTDWWMVTRNGVPVRFFTPEAKDRAERYCSDPEFRKALMPGPMAWQR